MGKLGQAGGGIVPTLSRCIVQAMSDAYHPGHIGSKIDLNVSPCLGIDLICLLPYTYGNTSDVRVVSMYVLLGDWVDRMDRMVDRSEC